MHRRNLDWCDVFLLVLSMLGVVVSAGAQESTGNEADTLNQQVEQLYRQGQYSDAIPLAQRSLELNEAQLGPEDPKTVTSLNNLALLYKSSGDYGVAESLYHRALAIRLRILGAEHPDTAVSLNNLGTYYEAVGNYPQAERLHQQALGIREKVLGRDHLLTAASQINLSIVYYDTGAYSRAEPLLRQALATNEKIYGAEHPNTSTVLNNLAALYQARGDYAKAASLSQRVVAIRQQALGKEHPLTAAAQSNLATIYSHRGEQDKAIPLLREALATSEKIYGEEHPVTASLLTNLGVSHRTAGDYGTAEPLLEHSLAITRKILGPTHPDTANSLRNLAVLHWASGNLTRAIQLMEQAQLIQANNTSTFFLSGSEFRKIRYLQQGWGDTSADISLSLALTDRQAVSLGLTSVLRTKGRVLDALSESLGRLRQSIKQEDHELFDELAAVAQQWSALIYQISATLSAEDYRVRLNDLATKKEQLETELSMRGADLRVEINPITLARIQAAIPMDAALVEWFRYQLFDPNAKSKEPNLGNHATWPMWSSARAAPPSWILVTPTTLKSSSKISERRSAIGRLHMSERLPQNCLRRW
ncbi:MAG: Kinesin light chain-like protein [Nitrospira sp.]|jgi:tetratricopeptide (TPR) repeat protein|nr:Kinesin light chain-like protein [Nitrospira sp.]